MQRSALSSGLNGFGVELQAEAVSETGQVVEQPDNVGDFKTSSVVEAEMSIHTGPLLVGYPAAIGFGV